MASSNDTLVGTVVSRAVIVGLGREGLEVTRAVRRRLDERVAPNLPTIRYLILAEREVLAQTGIQEDEFLTCLPLEWSTADLDEVRKLADVDPWLPDVDEGKLGDLRYRAAARLCLIKYYTTLQDVVRRLLLAIVTPTSEEVISAQVEVRRQPSTYFYLIASLANPLASGLLVDLAYLLGQAIRPVQDEDVTDVIAGVFRFVNGILLLPGFREGGVASVQSRLAAPAGQPLQAFEDERAAQTWEQAYAYAALLELDHYMDRNHEYRCEFRRLDGPVVVPAGYRPFWDGHCFLLGPAIEREQREYSIGWLTDVGVAVAESLYHRLAAPSAGFLEPRQGERTYRGRVSAYASFGVSAEVLPWRDLREYCVRRLSLLVVDALLKSEAPAERDEAENLLKRLQITPEALFRQLTNDADWEERLRREERPKPQLDRIPWYAARETEAAMMRDDHQWRRDLAEIDGKLLKNGEKILDEIDRQVQSEIGRLLDFTPAGGLQRAENLVRLTREEIAQEHVRQARRLDGLKSDLPRAHERVNRQRGRYFAAVGTLGRWFLVPTLTLLALALLFVATHSVIGQAFGQRELAWIVTLASTALYALTCAYTLVWVSAARASFITSYAQRQVAEREISEQERLVELYAALEQMFADLVRQLSNFRQALRQVRERCEKAYSNPDLHYRLYQKPSFVLERSVLTPEIVDEFFGEITQLGPENMATELGNPPFGPYSRWVFAGFQPDELMGRLERYADQRVAPLQRHGVLELLDRLGDDGLRRRMEALRELAQPMWDLDRLDPMPELQRVTAVEPGGEDSRPMVLLRQLCSENHVTLDRSSPHYLTHISIRWGAPLFAVQSVRRCRESYNALVRRGHLAELHTSREHQALADLLPWETQDPRTIFALARAFELISYDPANSQYYFLYQTNQDLERAQAVRKPLPDRRENVGQTKEEACRNLAISRDWYAMVAARVEEMVDENIQHVGGNPIALAYELYQYSQTEADLAAWEKEVMQAFCDQLHTGRPPLAPPGLSLIGRVTAPGVLLPRTSSQSASISATAPAAVSAGGGQP